MSDIIQLLPDSVANQIAAGEVIQRPASVIKELVENAIDAGGTDIKINISDAGKTLIQIIDNGCGMSDTDARMSFERHATSKIRKATDLFEIRTLGFRGEALASIAAIAQVTLKTKRVDDELGTQINISGSEIISQESVSCSSGSNFLIKNLFYNIPARRKFLKSNATELKHIISEFQRIALTNPQVKFSLLHNNTSVYHLESTSLLQRISQLFRKNINQSLVKISTETSIVTISGFIGKPDHARKSMGEQFFFVNNRYMKHPYFHKSVMMAYSNILPSDEWPSYFIYMDVDPQTVDINIHPTKTEIKFEDEANIWKILNLSVKESIGKFNISPSLDFETKNNISIPVTKSDTEIRIPEVNINPEYNPFEKSTPTYKKSYSKSSGDKDFIDNWEKLYQGFQDDKSTSKIDFKEDEPKNDLSAGENVFFQLKNKYILTSVKSGLMIIDQRKAHIKILFERYKSIQDHGKGFSQRQMFPIQIEPETGDAVILDELLPELYNLGFELEKKQGNLYSIMGTPADIKDHNPGLLVESLLEYYKNTGEKLELSFREKIALSLARASAINHGKMLDNNEMSTLFNGLFSCSSPTYTPDGKLIVSILDSEEIEDRFK